MRVRRPAAWGLVSRVGIGVLACGAAARAEIRSFEATVQSEVREYSAGSLTDSDFAFDSFPGLTTSNLPIGADAGFTRKDPEGEVVASGRGVTSFRDPRISQTASPGEFGLNAVAFSLDPLLSHESRCLTTETREIVFTTTDIGAEEGTALRVRSRFYLDGVMVIWSEAGVTDLSGISADMGLSVVHHKPDGSDETALTASVVLTGLADGTAAVQTGGAVTMDNLVVFDLTGLVTDLGTVKVVSIPQVAIPYEYAARVGEPFRLTAAVQAGARSMPAGRGATVSLGPTLPEVARVINEVTGSAAGDTLVQLLNATGRTARPKVPLVGSRDIEITVEKEASAADGLLSLFPACGAFGAEMWLMLLAGGGLCLLGGRQRA